LLVQRRLTWPQHVTEYEFVKVYIHFIHANKLYMPEGRLAL
jgi:hypothetical protein